MKMRALEKMLEKQKPNEEVSKLVDAENQKLLDGLLNLPGEEQCAKSLSWMKNVLINRQRLSKITQISTEMLLAFHNGDTTVLNEAQLQRVMYLITLDRKAVKERWPLKKVHDRRIKRHHKKQAKLDKLKESA